MDPVLAWAIVAGLGLVLAAVAGAALAGHRAGAAPAAAVAPVAEARDVAEDALDARLLVEERARREAAERENADLRKRIAKAVAGSAEDFAALAKLGAPGADGEPGDAGLLSAFPAGPAPGGDPASGAAAAPAAGSHVVAADA